MKARQDHDGLRKLCGCARRKWSKCEHPWHFNFACNGEHFRFTLDRRVGRIVRHSDTKRWVRDRARLGPAITTKTDAQYEANRLRTGIKDGSLLDASADRPALETLTLAQLLAMYDRQSLSRKRGAKGLQDERYQIGRIVRVPLTLPSGAVRPFGDWLAVDVTVNALEQFQASRQAAPIAANRNLALLRACFNWAILQGTLERTPFKWGTVNAIKLTREIPRSRRLEPGEADRLLAACGPHLRALVEAALETGCRKGELLSLQWHQIRTEPRQELFLPAGKTKTRRDRRIPISTRLAAILAMRRTGPDGVEHPSTAYVFGNEIGQRVGDVTRAWERAVLRAHGHTPELTGAKARDLTPACRAQLTAIGLHFHDLRREAASRWLDGGVPLHTIRAWIGHSNISQTSTYLESTFAVQHDAMAAFEQRQARPAGLQTFASKVETGHHSAPLSGTDANRNASEITQKPH